MPNEDGQTRLGDFHADGEDAGSDGGDDADDHAGEAPTEAADRSDAAGDVADDGASDRATDDDDSVARTSDDGGSGDTDVAPAAPTATWRPDGAACDGCGDDVERRWRDGEALVCADCVEW